MFFDKISVCDNYILLKTRMGDKNRWQIEYLQRFGIYTFFREWKLGSELAGPTRRRASFSVKLTRFLASRRVDWSNRRELSLWQSWHNSLCWECNYSCNYSLWCKINLMHIKHYHTVKSQISVRYLISYISYFWQSTKFNIVWKFLFALKPLNFNVIFFADPRKYDN